MRVASALRAVCARIDATLQCGTQSCPESFQRGANRLEDIGILVRGRQKGPESVPIGIATDGVVWPRLAGGAEFRKGCPFGFAGLGESGDRATPRQLCLTLESSSEPFRRLGEPGNGWRHRVAPCGVCAAFSAASISHISPAPDCAEAA